MAKTRKKQAKKAAKKKPAKKKPAKKKPAKKKPAKKKPAKKKPAKKKPSRGTARSSVGSEPRGKVLFVPTQAARSRPRAYDPGPELPAWECAGRSATRTGSINLRLDPPLEELWRTSLGGAAGTSPIVSQDGKVYVADREGVLYALDADSGVILAIHETDPIREASPIWPLVQAGHVPGARVPVSSPPVVSGGSLLFGDDEGVFYCLRRGEWSVQWRKAAPLELQARSGGAYQPALASRGVVYVACADGHAYAVEARSGRSLFRIYLRGEPTAPPALGGGKLLVATRPVFKGESPRLHALGMQAGDRLWHVDLPGSARALLTTREEAIVATEAGLSSIDLRRGGVRWEVSSEDLGGAPTCLSADRERVYVGWDEGLAAVDLKDGGAILWTGRTNLASVVTGLACGDEGVWLAAGRTLLAFDGLDGRTLGRASVGSACVGGPVLGWANLYVSTRGGDVVALAPEPGA